MKLKTTPHPYQLECVDEIEDLNGKALVALPMGCGKSLVSLLYLYNHPEITKTVVVCPASVIYVWEKEARKHLGLRCEILTGMSGKTFKINVHSKLYILSYTVLSAWLPFLKKIGVQLAIADEGHYLCNPKSIRTKAFKELCQGLSKVLILSGTPLVNRPAELWPLLNILRPSKWPNFYQYAHRFCNAKLMPWGRWDFRGASNLPQLHKDLNRYVMVRRKKEEVLSQLPPKTTNIIPIEINNKQEYNRAVKDFINWLKDKNPYKALKASRAEKIVKVGYLLRLAASLKMKGVIEWIDNFLEEDDGKLIIFAVHNNILSELEQKYKKICVKVDGSVIGDKRKKAFDQFNNLKKTKIFLGNIDAAGVGWSCTSASDTAFVELPWSPGKLAQAKDRTYGISRGIAGRVSRSWMLIAHGTIEEKLCKLLQEKQKTTTSILDGENTNNDLDIYDQLLLEMEQDLWNIDKD